MGDIWRNESEGEAVQRERDAGDKHARAEGDLGPGGRGICVSAAPAALRNLADGPDERYVNNRHCSMGTTTRMRARMRWKDREKLYTLALLVNLCRWSLLPRPKGAHLELRNSASCSPTRVTRLHASAKHKQNSVLAISVMCRSAHAPDSPCSPAQPPGCSFRDWPRG